MNHSKTLEAVVVDAVDNVTNSHGFTGSCSVAVTSGRENDYMLHPDEARLLAPRACATKVTEWTSGRSAAHLALRRLGFINPPPVLRGQRGEPLWPEGVVGSITHCYPWTIAITAYGSKQFGIGVDLESLTRLRGIDISQITCRGPEFEWISSGEDFQGRLAMIFSAKEALYKALYPFYRRYIDFKEVELNWVPEQSRFEVDFVESFSKNLVQGGCTVHSRRHDSYVFSICQVW
jgi:4'-phosphopantetheinyl transferase EntD